MKTIHASHIEDPRFSHVPSDKVCGKNMFNLITLKSFPDKFKVAKQCQRVNFGQLRYLVLEHKHLCITSLKQSTW